MLKKPSVGAYILAFDLGNEESFNDLKTYVNYIIIYFFDFFYFPHFHVFYLVKLSMLFLCWNWTILNNFYRWEEKLPSDRVRVLVGTHNDEPPVVTDAQIDVWYLFI